MATTTKKKKLVRWVLVRGQSFGTEGFSKEELEADLDALKATFEQVDAGKAKNFWDIGTKNSTFSHVIFDINKSVGREMLAPIKPSADYNAKISKEITFEGEDPIEYEEETLVFDEDDGSDDDYAGYDDDEYGEDSIDIATAKDRALDFLENATKRFRESKKSKETEERK